jgi:hypothetical protein
MKRIKWTLLSMLALVCWSCNESSSNERFIFNSSQKTIIMQRGYDRNSIYTSQEIYPGDSVFIDYQSYGGKWDMKTPMYSDYYYYGDSIFLEVANGFTLNKSFYEFKDWKCYMTGASALPSDFTYTSYFIIRDSDITP